MVWVPKTAGTSLYEHLRDHSKCQRFLWLNEIRFLFPGRGFVTFGHFSINELVRHGHVSNEFLNSAFTFGFVRNPYDRAVSLFKYFRRRKIIAEGMTFLEFCQALEHQVEPAGLYNVLGWSQASPQVEFMKGVKMSRIGRVESLDLDFSYVCQELQISVEKIPVKNVTADSGKAFAQYYCSESMSLVRHFYREDFNRFGYDADNLVVQPCREIANLDFRTAT